MDPEGLAAAAFLGLALMTVVALHFDRIAALGKKRIVLYAGLWILILAVVVILVRIWM